MDELMILNCKKLLEEKGEKLPSYVKEDYTHWMSRVWMARLLHKHGIYDEAYSLLREIYEQNSFHFHKDFHGTYEDYTVEKVQFFQALAELNMKVSGDARKSIPYMDEAIILLDSAESVHPYISMKHLENLKKQYVAEAMERCHI